MTSDAKKQARLAQLANARESAKARKRRREDDLEAIKTQLSQLTSSLATTAKNEQEKVKPVESFESQDDDIEARPQKRVRVRVTGAAGSTRRVVVNGLFVRASRRRVTRTYDRSVHVLEPDAQRHNLGARRT